MSKEKQKIESSIAKKREERAEEKSKFNVFNFKYKEKPLDKQTRNSFYGIGFIMGIISLFTLAYGAANFVFYISQYTVAFNSLLGVKGITFLCIGAILMIMTVIYVDQIHQDDVVRARIEIKALKDELNEIKAKIPTIEDTEEVKESEAIFEPTVLVPSEAKDTQKVTD